MKSILDMIVGNTFLFIGVLLLLGVSFVILILSIVKELKKKRKISIYEEEVENSDLDNVSGENIIEKPEIKHSEEEIEDSSLEEEEVEEFTSDEPYSEEKINELENISEEEIEKRIDKEHEEAIEEAIEDSSIEEMTDILNDLKDAKEVKPEDVVRQFEREQEAQSIISYQELVDVVKNRDNQFEDELESKPLATVSDFLPEQPKESPSQDKDMLELIEKLEQPKKEVLSNPTEEIEELVLPETEKIDSLEPMKKVEEIETIGSNIETLETELAEKEEREKAKAMVREALKNIPDDGKFKKTELISPVFGRIKEEEKDSYPSVKKFSREKKEVETLEPIQLPERKKSDNIVSKAKKTSLFEDITVEQEKKKDALFEEIPVEKEHKSSDNVGISKNEDFLKALKDFRNSL